MHGDWVPLSPAASAFVLLPNGEQTKNYVQSSEAMSLQEPATCQRLWLSTRGSGPMCATVDAHFEFLFEDVSTR